MPSVKKSRSILHKFITHSKQLTWKELIVAAESELQRIERRAAKLKEAIQFFTEREQAGDPSIGSNENSQAVPKKMSNAELAHYHRRGSGAVWSSSAID